MEPVSYRLRRSKRARRVRIVVDDRGVEVVAPEGVPEVEIERFFQRRRAWVERSLRRFEGPRPPAVASALTDGGFVPYLGSSLRLRVRDEPGRLRPAVVSRGTTVEIATPRSDRDSLRAALERWYRRRARTEVGKRLDTVCARERRSYVSLAIRGQRTRWASCSASGAMSFNWRLLLAPSRILDYVVEHEVAHLDVGDHSQRFWRLVAKRCPGYREHERWLRRFGHTLYL
jgi:predicted metal-dependent hydrolase